MTIRTATCRCGQFTAIAKGEPARVSACHCLECQRRSGSAFSVQAWWADADVTTTGAFNEWANTGESGKQTVFRFCTTCGSTLVFATARRAGMTAIAVGAFTDPDFPAPKFSIYEASKHAWVSILGDDVTHLD
jgi:hypothetical protein